MNKLKHKNTLLSKKIAKSKAEPKPKRQICPRKSKMTVIDLVICVSGHSLPFLIHHLSSITSQLGTTFKKELQIALVVYEPFTKPNSYQVKITPFTDPDSILAQISRQSPSELIGESNNNHPWVVMGGLWEATRVKWRKSTRVILHFPGSGTYGEAELWGESSPCGLNLDRISNTLKTKRITYLMVKTLCSMPEKFKQNLQSYTEIALEQVVGKIKEFLE